MTNTPPMGAFRGAGRPEAAELEIDPVELRRRNLLAKFDTSITTPLGTEHDTGDYIAALDEALRLAGYESLRAEQAARRARGDTVQLGIPMDKIRLVQSDTAAVDRGKGTGGSRSLQLGGTAVLEAARGVLERARSIAASELEASLDDIVVFDDGGLGVAGSTRRVRLSPSLPRP